MSQEVDIVVQISSVEQVSAGISTITAQSIGAVPLNGSGKIDASYLPDQASLDLEVDEKIANNAVKLGVQWTTRHTNSTGNPYLVGSIVYHNGRVFRCLATNDSIEPAVGGNPYWADLGVGYLLPNENPKIQGGSINTQNKVYSDETAGVEFSGEDINGFLLNVGTFNSKPSYRADDEGINIRYYTAGMTIVSGSTASFNGWVARLDTGISVGASQGNEPYPWLANWPNENYAFKQMDRLGGVINTSGGGSIETYGEVGSGGSIDTHGEEVSGGFIFTRASGDKAGGWINTQGGNGDGGNINTSGGSADGGSINTANGGGSIYTAGKGQIGLGINGERTLLSGTATANRIINLPNASGTIALEEGKPLSRSVFLKAVNFDLGKQINPLNAPLSEVAGYGFNGYTGYFVSEITILIKSRYRTQPVSSNLYTIPTIQAMPVENYIYSSTSTIALQAVGSPYAHPISGNYVLINNELMLIDQVFDLVGSTRSIRLRRGQLGSSPNFAHTAGATFGIFENTALFSTPPAVVVYNNSFGYAVSTEAPIGTRPFVGNYSRTINTATSGNSSGRQLLTIHDRGGINIQLVTTGVFLQTTTTALLSTATATIPVVANTAFSGSNFYARITSTSGTENVYVTSGGSGANMNVLRGVLGTTAIAHPSGATISTNVGNVGSTFASALLADVVVKLDPVYTP